MTTYTPPAEAVEAASAVMWARRIESPWSSASEHARASLRRDMTAALTAAGPLIEQAVRDRMRAAGPTLEIHAYGATPEQADTIFTAAMDAAYDAAPAEVAVDAVGKLAGRGPASPEGDTHA